MLSSERNEIFDLIIGEFDWVPEFKKYIHDLSERTPYDMFHINKESLEFTLEKKDVSFEFKKMIMFALYYKNVCILLNTKVENTKKQNGSNLQSFPKFYSYDTKVVFSEAANIPQDI